MVDGVVCERHLLVNWCDVIWRQGGSQRRFFGKPKIIDDIKSLQWHSFPECSFERLKWWPAPVHIWDIPKRMIASAVAGAYGSWWVGLKSDSDTCAAISAQAQPSQLEQLGWTRTTNLRDDRSFTITEEPPTRAFSSLVERSKIEMPEQRWAALRIFLYHNLWSLCWQPDITSTCIVS